MASRYNSKSGAEDKEDGTFSQDDDVVNHGLCKNNDEVANKDKIQAKNNSALQITATTPENIAQSVDTLHASNWN